MCFWVRASVAFLCHAHPCEPETQAYSRALGATGHCVGVGQALRSNLASGLAASQSGGSWEGLIPVFPDRVWLIRESQAFKVINGAYSTEPNAFPPFVLLLLLLLTRAAFLCLVALRKAASECPAASSVNLQGQCVDSLPLSFSPSAGAAGAREPRWTRQVFPGSASWPDSRPFLLAVA